MTPAVLLLNLGLSLAGMAALCLSLVRHHGVVLGQPLSEGRALLLRGLGWGFIALSLAVAIAFEGWNFGPVQWLGSLIGAGLLVTVILAYRPPRSASSQSGRVPN